MPEYFLKPSSESKLADIIRNAIGAGDYDEVRVVVPQFKCPTGRKIYYFPKTKEEFEKLKRAPDDILFDIGLRRWDENLWLFPGEWYNCIPDGLEVETILGTKETFKRGVSDDDIRFGCLPYGLRTENEKA